MFRFKELRVMDNFYQTSLFFPTLIVVISALCEDGSTTLGPYSPVRPYYAAGRDFYAMPLRCRITADATARISGPQKDADDSRAFADEAAVAGIGKICG